ncbi:MULTISPECIES: DNA-directed RNA polymerase subunit B [Acidianus]|uniref:DNA-directed RNA polymerase subunit beta n=1 Tax=Candidatus Acidianus copahuensis TaxID=1160895 RepID=A0A031LNG3_9CREN|nr:MULTISPECIES: DNA-directed RNA polymerase subunit B [Acidianus]EZQ03084.1 DNA-directed RNA polymerase subunit B [Candidatus Acidianus copahuensis]NON62936.1 DNA-directed RNA polymerase subunit B [Acidianus sp. RZ1]
MLSIDDRWSIVESFFKSRGLVRQHLDSFNDFLRNKLQEIIDEQGEIATEIPGLKIKLGKITVGKPRVREADRGDREITPMEARLRNLTYAAPVFLTMTPIENNIEGEPVDVYIGDIPIMLKSIADPATDYPPEKLIEIGEDPRDPGGYFIINGSEKVIVTQEDLASNRVLVDEGKSGSNITHTAKIISSTSGYRVPVTIERMKDSTVHISFPAVPGRIPFAILMKALGLESDMEITYAVSFDPSIQNELFPSLEQASSIANQEDALDFIGNRVAIGQKKENRVQKAEQIIDRYFLPHLGTSPLDRKRKAYYLGFAIAKIIELQMGRRTPDDKDHYANKRLKLAGDLFSSLFRVAFKAFVKDLVYQLEKSKVRGRRLTLTALVRPDIISERIRHAMATGNWVGGRTGVSQLLDRTNWLSMLSHLRRNISSLARGQPNFEARDLHGTQWGRMCPFETPEGPNSGLVKNIALLAQISVGVNEKVIEKALYELGVLALDDIISKGKEGEDLSDYNSWSKVILNGRLIGYYPNGDELADKIREKRRSGDISDEVNIAHIATDSFDEVYVNTDSGRVRRPLIVVRDGKSSLTEDDIIKLKRGEYTFDQLVKQGKIEFLDAEEEENAYIALEPSQLTIEHTHLEIWAPAMLGITASITPYPEHNQSPRNTYQSAMAKQALGLYAANYQLRTDSRSHLLHYPQKPLVQTKALEVIGYNRRPAGNNVIFALMSFTGYNMEDAIIMNKSSVDRGMFRSTFFRLYSAEEIKYPGGQEDTILLPEPGVRGYKGKEYYRLLDENGIVPPEVDVKGGDVLIGKVSPPRFLQEFKELSPEQAKRDTSIVTRHGEKGTVDLVLITETSEGNKLVKIRVRDLRIPELGDKFATRHGQKGVIGMLIQQADMPYTTKGIVPDIILNPHALPSRMTLGQIMEALAGKYAAITGHEVDATPFYGISIDELIKEFPKNGYLQDGSEVVYDGRTAQKIKGRTLFGIVYYQKLHHMVADKMHGRARGPIQILTRQPTEGRSREGGLRFGEMERDCLIGYGAAMVIKDRLLDNSDKATVYVCDQCGYIGWYDRNKNRLICPIHGDKANLYPVTISYAFKLLLQELMSMVIAPRLVLGDKVSLKGENNG